MSQWSLAVVQCLGCVRWVVVRRYFCDMLVVLSPSTKLLMILEPPFLSLTHTLSLSTTLTLLNPVFWLTRLLQTDLPNRATGLKRTDHQERLAKRPRVRLLSTCGECEMLSSSRRSLHRKISGKLGGQETRKGRAAQRASLGVRGSQQSSTSG